MSVATCRQGEVDSYKRQHMQCTLIDLVTSVRHDTNHDFLPTIGAPFLRLGPTAEMGNVLDHAMIGLKMGRR